MKFILVLLTLVPMALWADLAPIPRSPFWYSGLHRIGIEVLAAAIGGGALLHALRRLKCTTEDECRARIAKIIPDLKRRLKAQYDQALCKFENYPKEKLAEWLAICPDGAIKEEEKRRYEKQYMRNYIERNRNELVNSCREMIVELLNQDHALLERCVGIPIELLAAELERAFRDDGEGHQS